MAIFLTVTVLGFLAFDSYYWYRALIANTGTYLRLEELRGEIMRLDEVLTMSARMAAVTGDPKWEARYNIFDPVLDKDIKEAITLAPEVYSGNFAVETDTANRRLVQMERRSFQLVHENRKSEAYRILFSEEYQRQKEIYAHGMQEFDRHMKAHINVDSRKKREKTLSQIVLIFFAAGVLMLAWVMVLKVIRNWEKFFARQNSQLLLQANELAALNMNLDFKVAERTIELERSREAAEEARKKVEESKEKLEREMKERKNLEGQLLQAQKMDALGRLAGGIAHDFNNLLTVINGYAEMILSRLGPGDALSEEISEIQNAGNRAAALTSQLLTFSKRHIVSQQVINLNDVILNMNAMLSRLIPDNIEIETIPCADTWNIRADINLMEQVLMNLILNARDAIGERDRGKIKVAVTPFAYPDGIKSSKMELKPGEYVVLSVSDNGCGMSENVRAHLFEPFFTTKGKGKGTGLGLATSFGIVKQFGGYIDVLSEVGRGTTLKIYLPRVKEVKSAALLEERKDKPQGTETVLLVEDEEAVRKLAADILRDYGYKVYEAVDGDDALKLVRTLNGDKPHLLLTDVIMPRMNGKELAERIRVIYPEIKILFASGYTDDVISGKFVDAPGTAFINKPFLPQALAYKVRELLNVA